MNKLNEIDIVILCGGLGKRLREEIGETQKVMASIEDRPFLDILLEYVADQGFKRSVLCAGYKAETVEEYCKGLKGRLEVIISKENEALGTGGAIKFAQGKINSDSFFVLNGDCFCPLDYSRCLEFHKEKRAEITVAVSKEDERRDYGSIALDEFNRILSFNEKTDSRGALNDKRDGFVNAGVYCFNKKIFSLMPGKNNFSLETDVFPKLIKQGIFGYEVKDSFYDIGTPERLKLAKKFIGKVG